MRIQHNIPAMNAYRNFRTNNSSLSKNLEKLSSGYRINRAGDDAAGLAISEKMRAQISGLTTASSNAKDGISLVQTAEGALTEVHDMLNRMVTLAEQSSNGTYGDDLDRVQLQKEVDQLRDEINRIADSANFNGIKLLDGSMDSANAVVASSVTQAHTSFSAADWKTFNTSDIADIGRDSSGKYSEDDSTLGVNTIRHRIAPEAGKATFYLDLNNYAVTEAGQLNITVGGDALKTLTISSAELTSSSGEFNAAAIAKKLASAYGDETAVIGSNEFNISAEGNGLKFTSVKNVNVGVAMPVSISIGSTHNYTFSTPVEVSDDVTGAKANFEWDSAVSQDDKIGFSKKAGTGDFNVTVKVDSTLQAAKFNGTYGTKAVAVSAQATRASALGTKHSVVLQGDGSIKITAGTASGQKLKASDAIELTFDGVKNGTESAEKVTVKVTLKELGLASNATTAVGTGAVATFSADKVKAAIKSKAEQITRLVKNTTVDTNTVKGPDAATVSSGDANGVYVNGSAVFFSKGATAKDTDTIELEFGYGSVTMKLDVSIGDLRGTHEMPPASQFSVSGTTLQNILTNRVKALFGESSILDAPTVDFHGTFTVASGSGDTHVSVVSSAVKASAGANGTSKVNLTVNTQTSAGGSTGTFKITLTLNELDSSIGSSAISTSGTKTIATADVKNAIKTATKSISDAVSADNFRLSVNSWSVVATAGGSVGVSGVKKDGVQGLSIATTATSTNVLKFNVNVGGKDIVVSMKASEVAAKHEPALGYVNLSAEDVSDAIQDKLKEMFGKTREPDPDKTITLDAAPSGYEYHALAGNAAAGAVKTYFDFSAGVKVGTVANSVKADDNGMVEIEVWSTDPDANKIGTFKVDLSELKVSTDYYPASQAGKTITSTGVLGQDISYVDEVKDSGRGDYNTSTEVIQAGSPEDGNRLASTVIQKSVFNDKISDGTVLKIGGTNYMFAVGADSKLTQDVDGNVLVDLKHLEVDTDSGDKGLTGDNLDQALKALTLAAKDNAMFGVGFRESSGEITLTENVDYYGDGVGKVLLNHEDKIAEQISWGKVSGEQSIETVETPERKANDLTLQIGDTSDDYNQLKVSISDMHADAIGIGDIDISTQEGAQAAIDKIRSAINYVSDVRGGLGATQNRLEHTINNLSVMVENIQDAESTIRDTDIAEEMMAYTKNSILNQAAQAMLAQANQLPQGVLQLLG